jgi:hypothetical protein
MNEAGRAVNAAVRSARWVWSLVQTLKKHTKTKAGEWCKLENVNEWLSGVIKLTGEADTHTNFFLIWNSCQHVKIKNPNN